LCQMLHRLVNGIGILSVKYLKVRHTFTVLRLFLETLAVTHLNAPRNPSLLPCSMSSCTTNMIQVSISVHF
jgi:hypothetical protein